METRKRLAKIVLVFVGLFAVCWLPTHVLYLYRSFNYHKIDPSLGHMIITLVARVLSFCNSCVNPFALYFLSESFRRHFNAQLCCRMVPHRQRSASYLNSTSAIRMTSVENNSRNTEAMAAIVNGHNPKLDIPLWWHPSLEWVCLKHYLCCMSQFFKTDNVLISLNEEWALPPPHLPQVFQKNYVYLCVGLEAAEKLFPKFLWLGLSNINEKEAGWGQMYTTGHLSGRRRTAYCKRVLLIRNFVDTILPSNVFIQNMASAIQPCASFPVLPVQLDAGSHDCVCSLNFWWK